MGKICFHNVPGVRQDSDVDSLESEWGDKILDAWLAEVDVKLAASSVAPAVDAFPWFADIDPLDA